MKKILTILALVSSPSTTFASNWEVVSTRSEEGRVDSVDLGSIVQKGPYIRSWAKTSWASPQSEVPGITFNSKKILTYYNCVEREYFMASMVYYADTETDGAVVDRANRTLDKKARFDAAVPDSIGEAKLDYVCNSVKAKTAKK